MQKLVFVYNADSGFFNLASDIAHKIFSPATYPCSLCDLTYGVFSIRSEWKAFKDRSTMPMDFLHKDEFIQAYPAYAQTPLPVIFKADGQQLEVFIDHTRLNAFDSVKPLIEAIETGLKRL